MHFEVFGLGVIEACSLWKEWSASHMYSCHCPLLAAAARCKVLHLPEKPRSAVVYELKRHPEKMVL